jgi:hypothetical protein
MKRLQDRITHDDQATEEDLREVGRVAFGIVYPGDPYTLRKKPSPVTWTEQVAENLRASEINRKP